MTPYRSLALALLNTAELTVKEGGFVGQMAFATEMSPKQRRWFNILLDRHGLKPIGGDA